MKYICLAIFAVYCGVTLATPLLGQKECTEGPTFWCSNITNAKGCGAVKHCIGAVWTKHTYPDDKDDVCKICLDMVKEARDQLESNQTQEDLKAVFEGSCKLIPIDIVSGECIKLVDEFIPELVETLASQMNPQAVCSVAGLCNSVRIDKLLEEAQQAKKNVHQNQLAPVSTEQCKGCYTVINRMRNTFDSLSDEDFLGSMLKICFKLGSFSDSCAANVFAHYEELYTHVRQNFNADNVCHVAGTCVERFHQHTPEGKGTANVEITPMGDVGMVKDDLTCELCEQLVRHLRDILVANTTQAEFKEVLEGICKQTGSFKGECLTIVDQYYEPIYNFLISELNPTSMCFLAGICKKGYSADDDIPMAPLLPRKSAEVAVRVMQSKNQHLIGTDEANSEKHTVKIGDRSQSNVRVMQPELMQLPVDRMVLKLPQNREVCTFCQYFLHFLQVQISDAKNEEHIKSVVERACNKLPNTVGSECVAFVEAYGNAIIALLVQEIDPSQVCPLLTLCPKEEKVTNVEILMTSGNNDKPSCPLCLFAVEQLQTMLKNNNTEESIQHALDNLCSHLPARLKSECMDFVDTYSKQLVEMLVAEFSAQEVCVYLKLCQDNKPDVSSLQSSPIIELFHSKKRLMADHNNFRKPMLPKEMLEKSETQLAQIETNEIPDDTYNGKPLIYASTNSKDSIQSSSPQCVICEFIMTEIEKELSDHTTDEEIKKMVHSICNHLPKSVAQECNDFVDKYADVIISLITQDLAPAEVCGALHMCDKNTKMLQNAVLDCAVCEEAVDIVEQILSNPNVDKKIEHVIEKTCFALPGRYQDRCLKLMKIYGESIIHLVATLADSGKVCSEIGMCGTNDLVRVNLQSRSKRATGLVGSNKCTWGPSYWCDTLEKAHECNALEHCQQRVWHADAPGASRTKRQLGANKCTWGPAYWCTSEATAHECQALQHCQTNVWLASKPQK